MVRFQAANRLRAERLADAGHPDPAVRRGAGALHRPTGAGPPRPDRRIVISQTQNWVWLVRADGRVLAQGGVVDNPRYLRAGTYTAGAKCGRAARIRDNSDASGRLRLHSFTRFAPCGIGFHQIPQYRSTGAQIHADFLLGTDFAESHGCIRVSRAMSHRIWDFATAGTKVVVLR